MKGDLRKGKQKTLMAVSVASMIDQFNLPNLQLMQEAGYEVHVACNFKKGNTCDQTQIVRLQARLKKMGVVYHQWDCPRSPCAVWACIRAYRQMAYLARKYLFAWIHCQSPVGGALARIAAHRLGIRVLYTAHGFHFCRGAPWRNWALFYPAEKLLADWTDVLVTVNEEDYQLAKQRFGAGQVERIAGVGIDVERYAPNERDCVKNKRTLCRKFRIPEDTLVILSVGELSKRKNHRLVLQALARLGRRDICYLICGQGSGKRRLQRYARRLGVGHLLRIVGYQRDMPWIYHGADLFVFPSVREGMPVALMEAMAAGLPCIVSDIRGNRELITDAFLRFPPDSLRQLEKLLLQMILDAARREKCGRENQEKIRAYGLEVVQKKMGRIYQEMGNQLEAGTHSGAGNGRLT